jgi:hypothetical protein
MAQKAMVFFLALSVLLPEAPAASPGDRVYELAVSGMT